jgi:hypothetical protein
MKNYHKFEYLPFQQVKSRPKIMTSLRLLRKRTHYLVHFLTLVLFMALLSDCYKETEHPRDYPRLNTLQVANISSEGATFIGEIFSPGTETIKEYGFMWGTVEALIYGINERIMLDLPAKEGQFSADVRSALQKEKKYYVKPYVITENHFVFGPPVTFMSKGSNAPAIFGFEPESAGWEDTIKISGKYFSWYPPNNAVKLNQVICTPISSTDTTLTIKISPDLLVQKSVLSVSVSGNLTLHTKDTFNLIAPAIRDFSPKQARWGDTIYMKGRDLRYLSFRPGNNLKLGTLICQVLSPPFDSIIKFRIPYELTTVSSDLNLNLNGLTLHGEQQFQLLPPLPFTVSPKEGTWGNILTLTGQFNTISSRNSVLLNSSPVTIISTSPTALKVQIPASLSDIKSKVVYKADPFIITSADSFRLLPPLIKSFSPSSGAAGTTVTIKGKYFGVTSTPVIMFGTIAATVTNFNDSVIYTSVPSTGFGPVKISVTAKLQKVLSESEFNLTNPSINSVFPITGTFDDIITITGENLIPSAGSTILTFNELEAKIVSASSSLITARIPRMMDSIPRSIKVQVGAGTAISTDKVTLLAPVISSISPVDVIPGQEITISGQYFNPDSLLNEVYWDIYPLSIRKSSGSQIIVRLPAYLPRGTMPLRIVTGGYKRNSGESCIIRSQWRRIPLTPGFTWSPDMNPDWSPYTNTSGIFYTIGGKGYLLNYQTARLYSFDPSGSLFTNLGIQNMFVPYKEGLLGVTNQDTFYLAGRDLGFLRYNLNNNTWVKLCNLPTTEGNGVLFSIGEKMYFGLTSTYRLSTTFWEFDKSTKAWIARSNFPFASDSYRSAVAYYSDNQFGYVLLFNHTFYKYDPVSDTWTQLASIPLPPGRYLKCSSFVLNNKFYAGLGYNQGEGGSTLTQALWSYDPVLNNWTISSHIPGGYRYNAVSFVINDKVYIGLGANWSTRLNDFYEFDPNYTLK